MLTFILMLVFLSAFCLILGFSPFTGDPRPKLQLLKYTAPSQYKRKKSPLDPLRKLAIVNKPFVGGVLGRRVAKDLARGQVDMTPEEFFGLKELGIVIALFVTYPSIEPDMIFFWISMSFVVGYMLPEFWLKGKVKKQKNAIVRDLPDSIDLLGLCVNAGLDFMLALKWVIEKSPPTALMREFNIIMQEISIGKTRRDAIKDLALKYDLPDLSSFARTLIQADKMGTSVAEALNILSEDMRLARFRRGEQMALKAPLKMLVPLLLFIFPVVGVLVAGPIFLDFIMNNPIAGLTR